MMPPVSAIQTTHSAGLLRPTPLVSPDDQKVTFVELFFDLVFVFCVTQVVALFHGHLDLRSAVSALSSTRCTPASPNPVPSGAGASRTTSVTSSTRFSTTARTRVRE
jgi:hypothetical protein